MTGAVSPSSSDREASGPETSGRETSTPRPELIAFDLDGTLVDSEPGIVRAIAQTVAALGLPLAAIEAWRAMIGLPLTVQLGRLLPEDRCGAAEIEHAVALYRGFYFQLSDQEMGRPFAGMSELLAELRGRVKLAIATSKGRPGVDRVLAHVGWDGWFDPIVTPESVTCPKPHPESLLCACARHAVAPAATIYVGDARFDMEMAVRAGAVGWGAAWGLGPRAALAAAGARRCFDSPAELRVALLEQLS